MQRERNKGAFGHGYMLRRSVRRRMNRGNRKLI